MDLFVKVIVEKKDLFISRAREELQKFDLYKNMSGDIFDNHLKNFFGFLIDCLKNEDYQEISDFIVNKTALGSANLQIREVEEVAFTLKEIVLDLFEEYLEEEKLYLFFRRLDNIFYLIRLDLLDKYSKIKEEFILKQTQSLYELSTPVVPVSDSTLIMPLIGIIDTNRGQQIMEELLQAVKKHQANFIIIDVTGVPIVDTAVAQHIFKTVKAAQLLGAECIVAGISPEVAQTLTRLGIDFAGIRTVRNIRLGLELSLKLQGKTIVGEEK